jgi:hypothetical protein
MNYYQDPHPDQETETGKIKVAFTLDKGTLEKALQSMKLDQLYDTETYPWEFRDEVKPGILKINNKYTYDMVLTFKLQDMQRLYDWDQGMEFKGICELAAGDFEECHRESFTNYEDFRICVEAKLVLLNCFNYLSED